MGRFVKLYESFIDWEWHTAPEVVSLFMHLLILAQYKDYRLHGMVIKRGQLVTTLVKLSELTLMSVQRIRTCLKRLESTGEISQKSTNKFRVITICNYDKYQATQQAEQQTTNKQSTNNQQSIKQEYIERIENVDVVAHARARIFDPQAIENACRALCVERLTYLELAEQVFAEWSAVGEQDWSPRHHMNTMRVKVEAWRKAQRGVQRTETPLERRERAAQEAELAMAMKIAERLNQK